jgi:hypothetical protein
MATTEISRSRINAARIIAVLADSLQLMVFPAFVEGAASPFDTVLDVIVGGLLWALLGFHWALLPSFIAEMMPGLDLVPTWSAAVFLITGVGLGGTPKPGSTPAIDVPAVPVPPPAPSQIEPPKP